jgi:hypothetical protein
VRPRYAIICRRCVELGREKTIHVRSQPWTHGCAEHSRAIAAKLYRERHPKRARACVRASRKRHIEKRAAYDAVYAREHQKARRAYWRQYHAANRERILARKRDQHRVRIEARAGWSALVDRDYFGLALI